jgi:hypothetical protein
VDIGIISEREMGKGRQRGGLVQRNSGERAGS